MKHNVAVISGGYSNEKAISIKSAKTVYDNLDPEKYLAYSIVIDEKSWVVNIEGNLIPIDKSDFSFSLNGQKINFDVAFIAIHGTPGEDGKLQSYFDMINMPYTTCNALASALTCDKYVCNRYLKTFGIPVAEAILIRKNEKVNPDEILKTTGLPCFVKPTDGGSSYGVTKVENASELNKAVAEAHKHGSQVLIESLLIGREITNGIYKSKNGIHVLPITEIVTSNDFFDFDAKYNGESDEITPADLDPRTEALVKETTQKIYQILDLTGIVRADYILHNGIPHLIEINGVPGLSNESIIPQMAEAEGISLQLMFSEVIEYALSK